MARGTPFRTAEAVLVPKTGTYVCDAAEEYVIPVWIQELLVVCGGGGRNV